MLLLKAIVLTDEQAEKYGDILTHTESVYEYEYTTDQYYIDCENRNELTCSSIDFENSKFTASITTGNKDELVFFSIPYESGWSATVNGESVEIEEVNIGFMAVRVPANQTSEIVFTYSTPGLSTGAVISCVSVVLFISYMMFWRVPRKKRENGELILIDDMAYLEDLSEENNEASLTEEIYEQDNDSEIEYQDSSSDESAESPDITSRNETDAQNSGTENVNQPASYISESETNTDNSPTDASDEGGPKPSDDEGFENIRTKL